MLNRRHTRVWRQLRSARASALPPDERRRELREAQERDSGGPAAAPAAPVPPKPGLEHAADDAAGPAGDVREG